MWDDMEIALAYLAVALTALWILCRVADNLNHKNRM